jgi:hypothetical protein
MLALIASEPEALLENIANDGFRLPNMVEHNRADQRAQLVDVRAQRPRGTLPGPVNFMTGVQTRQP